MRFPAGSCLLAACVALAASPARAVDATWARHWRADLAFLQDTLPKLHPNPYHTTSRAELERELDALAARLERLEHHEITVELGRIVARIGDGHTRLTFPFDTTAGFFTGHAPTAAPAVPGLGFRHLPVRLHDFADGLHVIRATPEHAALLGGKVIEIGGLPVERARAAVTPAVQRDNDQQVRDLLPKWLVVPEILHARGVAPERERVRLVVETPEGARREAWLSPVPPGTKPQWREARALAAEPPLAEREPARRHWFRRVAPATVYARYREVYDDPGRTVAAFAEDLFAELRAADRLVLDLRGNVGGNNYLNQPLLHGVIAAPGLKRPGALFVLADRGTFSAAMMLLADLEHHAPAILVGEKSGAAPNGYGDSRRVRLPNTGLTVRVSTLYWQMTSPTDDRDGIAPHVAVEPAFAQWREGTDPALDRALALAGTAASPLDGVWEGVVSIRHERYPLRVAVRGSAVTLDAAALAAAGVRPADARIERGELAFSHRGAGAAWEFRARASGSTMLGVARFQGSHVPFVLTKR